MLERLNELLTYPRVSGDSKAMSLHLLEYGKNLGHFATMDSYGNVLISSDKNRDSIETLFLFPIDLPGLINLYSEDNKAYLSQTSSDLLEWKEYAVRDRFKNLYSVECAKENGDQLYISGRKFNLGETFDLCSPYEKNGESYNGFGVSSALLLALSLEMLEKLHSEKQLQKGELTSRILSKLAVIFLTALYVNQCFDFQINIKELSKTILSLEQSITADVDIADKAFDCIIQYVAKHKNNFLEEINYSVGSIHGKIQKKDEYFEISILKTVVEKILNDNDFENHKIIHRMWIDKK